MHPTIPTDASRGTRQCGGDSYQCCHPGDVAVVDGPAIHGPTVPCRGLSHRHPRVVHSTGRVCQGAES